MGTNIAAAETNDGFLSSQVAFVLLVGIITFACVIVFCCIVMCKLQKGKRRNTYKKHSFSMNEFEMEENIQQNNNMNHHERIQSVQSMGSIIPGVNDKSNYREQVYSHVNHAGFAERNIVQTQGQNSNVQSDEFIINGYDDGQTKGNMVIQSDEFIVNGYDNGMMTTRG